MALPGWLEREVDGRHCLLYAELWVEMACADGVPFESASMRNELMSSPLASPGYEGF